MANSDCISREAAIEAIRSECVGCVGQEIGERFCSKCAIRQREVALYSVPDADVIPVAWIASQVDKGKWAELIQRWRERNV